MKIEKLIRKIRKIEKSTDSRLHRVELYSDGSGCLKGDKDQELMEWDNLAEMEMKLTK